MVICPIARMVHCTGCILVEFCPGKTILGDYGKEESQSKGNTEEKPTKDKRSAEQSDEAQ